MLFFSSKDARTANSGVSSEGGVPLWRATLFGGLYDGLFGQRS